MPLEPTLKAMLVETVAHSAFTGHDSYGKPQYAAAVPIPARIESRILVGAGEGGQQRTSTTQVYLDSDTPVGVKDKLVLPDGSAPAIQDVQRHMHADAPARVHHFLVVL